MNNLGFRAIWLKLFSVVSLMGLSPVAAAIAYPDFTTSMLRTSYDPEVILNRQEIYGTTNQKYLQLFKTIYEKNIASVQGEQNETDRIPRIVHQIWLGSPVPEKYRAWMQSWADMEGWEYKLWTDEEVQDFKLYNQELYDQSTNFGEKSDIVRLEILNKFGGLYVDTDFECVHPQIFDELNRCYDFYIGFEPLEHGHISIFNMFKVCNALIAACPHHPLIADFITNLKANYYAYKSHCGPVEKTGPSYLSRIICRHEEKKVSAFRNMYLPSTFFYPFTESEIRYYACHPEYPAYLMPESAAIHYWNGSWRLQGCYSEPYIVKNQAQ